MRLYQKLAIAGAAIAAGIVGAYSLSKGDSPRENTAKPSLERVITEEKPVEVAKPIVKQTNLTEANKALRAFPNTFGKYGSVEKHETPEAKYCLAHIGQVHYRDPPRFEDNEKLSKKQNDSLRKVRRKLWDSEFQKVNSYQKGVYAVLKMLSKKGYNELRLEGASNPMDKADCSKQYNLTALELISHLGKRKDYTPYALVPGAALIFGGGGEMKILPAEKEEVYERAKRNPENKAYVQDAREDALLELVDKAGKPFSMVVYGSDHKWKDNIDRWNKQYPTKKFSWIEVDTKKID